MDPLTRPLVDDSKLEIENCFNKIGQEINFLLTVIKEQDQLIKRLREEKIELESKRHKLNKLDQPLYRIMAIRKTLNNLFEEGYLDEEVPNTNNTAG
jgi:hypothetical protein